MESPPNAISNSRRAENSAVRALHWVETDLAPIERLPSVSAGSIRRQLATSTRVSKVGSSA
jgi:hypothetical protein